MTRKSVVILLLGLTGGIAVPSMRAAPIRIYEGKGYSQLTFDRSGAVLDIRVASDGRYRVPIHLEDVPAACVEAALRYEDRNFFQHPGVDPIALLRAAVARLTGSRSGGSTITMQLVRLRAGLNTRTARGKLEQMWQALVLERWLDKQAILAGYFTFAPYGGGIEGIAAASAIYFGKTPEQLSRAECVALAVLPQSPSARFGFRGPGFERAFARLADRLELSTAERSINFPRHREIEPRHLARHVTTRVLSGGGARTTTIDRHLQRTIEQTLADYVDTHSHLGLSNGSILVADATTGDILGYVGSRDFADATIAGFVDGVRAKRSLGSLLKPFIYAKAIDEGLIVPDSVLTDIPIKLASYEPENFERDFLGLITARRALVKSRNVPALLLNARLAGDGLYSLLRGAGIQLRHEADYYGAAVVLGGIEVSLLEAVRLYSAFVTGGIATPLQLTPATPIGTPVRLFSAESALLTREMLATNPAPSGFAGGTVAWKTGTSSGARDAWAVGLAGTYVVGVWLGHFDSSPNANFIGRDLAGPLLFRIIERVRHLREHRTPMTFRPNRVGLHLRHVALCPDSGQVHTARCPHAKQGLIIPGVSPIKLCEVHRSGADAAVFPSEVDAHYASAGLRLSGTMQRAVTATAKLAPRVISPEEGLEYRSQLGKPIELELRANVDGEVRQLHWYVDGEWIGESPPGRSLFWRATPGARTIRVLDSLGGSDAVRVKILPQEN
ncbi:MAG TPA: penicillin-binding protein 1C [Terriglobales bacterium]|nr:penicillin-binding protein 1C [Terriglobales bacterium]